jgi:hypothetical protein
MLTRKRPCRNYDDLDENYFLKVKKMEIKEEILVS